MVKVSNCQVWMLRFKFWEWPHPNMPKVRIRPYSTWWHQKMILTSWRWHSTVFYILVLFSLLLHGLFWPQGRPSMCWTKMSMPLIWLDLFMTNWVTVMGLMKTVPRWRREPMCCFLVITLETWECQMVWTMKLEYLWDSCKLVRLCSISISNLIIADFNISPPKIYPYVITTWIHRKGCHNQD